MKKLAVFDLDGTFFRWQLYHELVFEFKERGLFAESTARQLDESLLAWQSQNLAWHDYEMTVVQAFEPVISQITARDFEAVVMTVIERSGHKVYRFTRRLRKSLAEQGYYTLAISGSPQEIVEVFALGYGFDEAIGALYAQANGVFTGEIARHIPGRKHQIIAEYLAEHPEFSMKDSVGVGDSNGNISLLEMVERPIAFNPDTSLLEVARAKGWPIIIERKNIAYKLEDRDGTYILADTDQF